MVVLASGISLGISLGLDPVYRAELSLFPLSAGRRTANPFAGIASAIGLPSSTSIDSTAKIIAILRSRTLRENLVRRLSLEKHLSSQGGEEARFRQAVGQLGKMISISEKSDSGLILVRVEYTKPAIARDIANASYDILDRTLTEESFTVSQKKSAALKQQLDAQEGRLYNLQSQLAAYQGEKSLILPEDQANSAVRIYSDLLRQRLALDLELTQLESALSETNAKVIALKKQQTAINEQIAAMENQTGARQGFSFSPVPEDLIEYYNILQNLDATQKIYLSLLTAYEQAKLEEAQEILFVQVVDPAISPQVPIRPDKSRIVMISALLTFVAAILLVLFLRLLELEKPREVSDGTISE